MIFFLTVLIIFYFQIALANDEIIFYDTTDFPAQGWTISFGYCWYGQTDTYNTIMCDTRTGTGFDARKTVDTSAYSQLMLEFDYDVGGSCDNDYHCINVYINDNMVDQVCTTGHITSHISIDISSYSGQIITIKITNTVSGDCWCGCYDWIDNIELSGTYSALDTPPKYFNVNQNKTIDILPDDAIKFYAYWTDDVGLSGYVFSTNVIQIDCSDGWDNSSWQEMTGTGNWSNYTWTIPSGCGGKLVEWKIYANDTSNNWNFTIPIKTFEVEPVETTTLVFKKEWNLISIPNETTINIIDDPCDIFSRGFYYYNASKGNYEVFSLEELEGGKGYWMYSPSMDTCEVNVTVSGVTKVSHIPSLISGYNLIGAPSTPTSANSLCSIIDGPYYWNADAQDWVEIDPTDTLESEMGYWLKCS